jgi:uncharacterized protein YfaS (alpha-2-macroglobulin family)
MTILFLIPGILFVQTAAKKPKIINSKPPETYKAGMFGEFPISFSLPIVELSDYDMMTNLLAKKIKITVDPSLKGFIVAKGTQTASFVFLEPLKPSTKYVFTINANEIKSVDGKEVVTSIKYEKVKNNKYEYTTPLIQVSSCYIQDKTLSPYLYLSFNSPVDLESFKKSLEIEDEKGNRVDFFVKWNVITNKRTENGQPVWYIYTNNNHFYIYPQGLKPSTQYYVTVKSGLEAEGGTIPLKKSYYYKFSTYEPLEIIEWKSSYYNAKSKYYPGSAIVVVFNNTLNESEKLKQFVTVAPKVENFRVSASGSYLYINGDFVGGETYKVSVQKGVEDVYGQKLANGGEESISFEHAFSYFSFPTGYMVMENYLPYLLPFKVRNVSALDFSYVFFSSIDDIAKNLKYENSANQKTDVIQLKWKWDKLYFYKLDLSKKVSKKSGLMFYTAYPERENVSSAYNDYDYPYHGMILFTDLGVTVKFGTGETMVYVRSLKNNQSVKGAKVYEIYDGKAAELGSTGMDGILVCKTLSTTPLIGVEYQSSIGLSYGGNTKWWGDPYYVNETRLMMFSDRYLYKPGDSIEIKGIVRFRSADQWTLDKSLMKNPVTIDVFNSKNEKVTNFNTSFSDWGSFNFKFNSDPNGPTGYYYVYAYFNKKNIGYYQFRVEDYKPAKAEMKIIPLQDTFIWGEKFKCDLIGWYLFGAPIIKPISYNISVSPATYWSSRYPQYNFGQYSYYWDDTYERDYSFTLASETMMPDKDGRVNVEHLLENTSFKGDGLITISASTVLDDKSTVYSSKSGMWLYNPVHLGINIENYFVEQGKPFSVNLIALDPQENVYAGQKATLEIVKQEWKSVQKVQTGGKVYWEWVLKKKIVHKEDVLLGKKTATVKCNEPGYYHANLKGIVRGHELTSSWSFYVIGKGNVGWKIENDNVLSMESDKKEYEVGDTAKVLVKNPYKNAKAMITIEREKIHSVQFMDANDSMLIIPVKITEDYIPNIYVSVMLYTARSGTGISNIVDGVDTAKPAFKMGNYNLSVVSKEKKLSVTVKADKEKYEPGQKATVTVTVKDYQNKTIPAEVTLAVVDKGVLNLVNYQIPNPMSYFYAQRTDAIYTSDISDLIIGQRYLAEKGEVIGGDGDMEKSMEAPSAMEGAKKSKNGAGAPGMIVPRINFKATAYYTANLIINQGVGTVSFTVPDNLSTFKIMAVAQTKDSKFGYGDSAITVSKPLMILPTLPEFVRLLDEVEAGGMVYNYTGADANVTVSIKADSIVQFMSKTTTNVSIPKNGSTEVKFKFKIIPTTREKLDFVVTAQAGNFTDGVQKTLPVKMPKFLETTAIYEKTPDKAKEKLLISENVVPEMSRLEFNLSPSAFSELSGNVDYLIRYPYGCLEQKTSQVLPLILGSDIIIKHKLLKEKTADDLKEIVNYYIGEVKKYIKSYGFGYYPDSPYHCPYLTIYTTFALTMAKQAGYNVPNDVLQQAKQWIVDYGADRGSFSTYGWQYSEYFRYLTQAFALYVAAMNGNFDIQSLKRVYNYVSSKLKDNLPAKANVLKAAYYYKKAGKNVQEVAAMINDLQTDFYALARVETSTVYFEGYSDWGWFYYNNIISTSLILQGLLESDADFKDAHKVINWLIKARKGDHWTSTHENAMVFWSMSTYLRKYEKEDPNFAASVYINQDKIINTMFKSPTDPIHTQGYKFKAGTKGELNINIEKMGTGMLYYYVKYQYMLKEYPKKKDAGFNVSKAFFDYDTGAEIKNNVFIRGKRYIVKIYLYTPKDRVFAVINDQLPAGFEPVNLDFATEANEKKVKEGGQSWWGSFYHNEKYIDRVIFSADYLYSGSHTITYVVRATTPGNFQVPQIWAEEMYFPETFGYAYQPNVTIIEESQNITVDKQK